MPNIAFRSTSTGPNVNASSTTISLPVGILDGDFLLLSAAHANNGTTTDTFTGPSGWTNIYDNNRGSGVWWKIWHTGDPTTAAISNPTTNWYESLCVAYSGVDSVNPVDVYSGCSIAPFQFPSVQNKYRAPQVFPNYDDDTLLLIYTTSSSSGQSAPTLPGGFTSRAFTGSGPAVQIAEQVLGNTNATGYQDITWATTDIINFGMQVALHASGSIATTRDTLRPVFAGLGTYDNILSSFATDISIYAPQTGDLILFFVETGNGGTPTITPPSGYTLKANAGTGTANQNIYAHKFTGGDSTSLTWTLNIAFWTRLYVVVLRTDDPNGVNFDAAGTSTGTGTVTSPTISPANNKNLFLAFFGDAHSTSNAWTTTPTGLTIEDNNGNGPDYIFAWKEEESSPSGTYTGANGTADTIGVVVMNALAGFPSINLSITETGSAADHPSIAGLTLNLSVSESGSISDSFRVVGKSISVAESGSISDSFRVVGESISVIESFSAAETLTRRLTVRPIIIESFIPNEHLSQRVPKKTFALNMAERALLADIISAKNKQTWNLHILETMIVSETLNTLRLYNRTVLEQTIPSDTISAKNKQTWNLNVLESGPSPLQDIISLHAFINRSVLEQANMGDVISERAKQIWNLNIVEAVLVQDLTTRKTLFNRSIVEQDNLADLVHTRQTWNLNILEASPPHEILTTLASFNRIWADQIIANDLIAATIRSTLNLTVIEGASTFELFDNLDVTEAVNMMVIDQALLADLSVATIRQSLNLTILEGVLPSEGTNPLTVSNLTNSEHVTVADSFIAAVNQSFNITESTAIADIVQLTARFNRGLVDEIEFADDFAATTSRLFIWNLNILEGSPMGEVIATNRLLNYTIPEQASIADLISARLHQTWNLNILEGIAPGEIANPFSLFNLTVPERLSIDDLVPAKLAQTWNLTTLEGTAFSERIHGVGGTTSVWDMVVQEFDPIQEMPDIVRIHFTRDIVAVFLSSLLTDPAYAQFVSPSAALARLLMVIEIIRAYLAEIGTAHEAKTVQRVLTKFNSAIKAGTDYESATEITIGIAHSLRVLIVHSNAFEDTDQIITPTGRVVNYTNDIVNQFYPTVVSARYQGFDNAPVWQRLLTIIEVLHGYFIEVQTPSEARLAHDVINRMIATIKFGGYLNE